MTDPTATAAPRTLPAETVRALRRAGTSVRTSTERRNSLIRDAHTAGGAIREIARAVGLSDGTVHTMLKGRKR